MPIILSFAQVKNQLWAAGPEGLFVLNDNQLTAVPQPEVELACCGTDGERILVGGLPHGTAFSLDGGGNWQASWMDGVEAPVLCMAADPHAMESGVMLAGSAGGGLLRSHNHGHSWTVCNFGLQDYTVLTVAWAPIAPAHQWPRWEVAFAGTEEGVYRSPNAGRGWKRSCGVDGVVQIIAVAPDFHSSGVVLVGTEEQGLWRSEDGGRAFTPIADGPSRVDALTSTANGWLLSDEAQLWQSADGKRWQPLPASKPALTLFRTEQGIWSGGEHGAELLAL
jgi:ligand-binding sensor domain-containing protein